MRISNFLKKSAVAFLTIVLFFGGVFACKLLFTKASATDLFNHHIKEIEESGENVDMIMFGASRTYRSLDPDIFEAELGLENIINDATPAQRAQFSYYMLKDMFERFKPKYVLLGATYNLQNHQSPHDFTLGMDRLSLKNRIKCATDIFGPVKGLMVLTGKTDWIDNMTPSNILPNLKSKMDKRKGINNAKTQVMKENGYIGSLTSLPMGGIHFGFDEHRKFDVTKVEGNALEYYDKMIDLCKENGAEVILFSGICSTSFLYSVEHYQDAVTLYQNYAKEKGITYYNMNYYKGREQLFPDKYFKDALHLNNTGGQLCSKIFSQILKDQFEGKDTSHYFYKDFDEMAKDVHRIPGTASRIISKDGEIQILGRCYCNKDVKPQYRVLVSEKENPTAKDYKVVAKWTSKPEFTFSKDKMKNIKTWKLEVKTDKNYDNELIAWKTMTEEDMVYE